MTTATTARITNGSGLVATGCGNTACGAGVGGRTTMSAMTGSAEKIVMMLEVRDAAKILAADRPVSNFSVSLFYKCRLTSVVYFRSVRPDSTPV